MDTLLLVVTVVSLALAATTSLLAWRVMREDRVRSAARVAALTAGIANDPTSTLSAFGDAPAGPPDVDQFRADGGGHPSVYGHDGIFAERESPTSRFRLVTVVAAGALVAATVIGGLVALSGPREAADAGREAADAPPARAAVRAATDVPLELVALGHERQADRLTVRGVVRNPPIGSDVKQLTAVVLVFDTEGGLIGTASATVDAASVAPGAERPFLVSIPAGANVGRYRVSFKSDEQVIPHVDKRS